MTSKDRGRRAGGRVTRWRSSSGTWLTTCVTSGARRRSRRVPRMPTGRWPSPSATASLTAGPGRPGRTMRPTRSSSTTCRRSTCWAASSARTRCTPAPPGWPARPWPGPGTPPGSWRSWMWSPGWGTGGWAGWPPACWTRWPPWTCRRWATASGMSSGSSSRPSRMAIRSSTLMTGPSTATRGSSPLPMTCRWSGSTATPRRRRMTRAGCGPAGCRPRWCGASPATCWSRATAPRRSTSCGCGAPGPARSRSTWACSTPAGTPRRSRRRCARRT